MVESGVEGGAMHHANFAKSQGRVLMAVLASSDATRGALNEAGAKHLVAMQGAIAIQGTGDLSRQLEAMRSSPPASAQESALTLF
jgi:predicted Rossmann fold nucleotide-binding protein DprA/Smf involved in DNA uptake